jgi:hypothetical protein
VCGSVKTLCSAGPSVAGEEARATALHGLCKVHGSGRPSSTGHEAVDRPTEEAAEAPAALSVGLVATAAPRHRETKAVKAFTRAAPRPGT